MSHLIPLQNLRGNRPAIHACVELTEENIACLYLEFREALIKIAHSYLKSIDDCQEIVQELFEHLLTKREHIKINQSVKAYLKTALRNRVYNYMRNERALNRKHILAKESQPVNYEIEEQISANDLNRHVYKILDERIKPEARQLFLLKKKEEFTLKEISFFYDLPETTIEKRLRKTVALVKNKLPFDRWK